MRTRFGARPVTSVVQTVPTVTESRASASAAAGPNNDVVVERAFVFTDIESSTAMWEAEPEAMQRAMTRHDEITEHAVARVGGEIVKSTGDGALCSFVSVDAAVEAATTIFRVCGAESWPTRAPIRLRGAINHGVAFARRGDYFGPTLNRAARLEAAAHGGQLLASADAIDRLSPHPEIEAVDLGHHQLRGIAEPMRVFQVVAPGLERDFPPLRTARHKRMRLPGRRDAFVGRDRELRDIRDLLREERLVTLVGPGGVGKTRLATELAASMDDDRSDVSFCDLRRAVPGAVAPVLVAALGGTARGDDPVDTLVELLGHREALVVVDNAEHVHTDVASLLDVLLDQTEARFVVTSRLALEVPGELVQPVTPLECEQLESAGPQLFLARAAAPVADIDSVVAICRRLDGLPLAIEMAARHAGVLTPGEILAGLDERFLLLGDEEAGSDPARTLWGTIEWSMQLLEPGERALFEALSVFGQQSGPTDIARVTGVPLPLTLRRLSRLVSVSLLQRAPGVETRVSMLESVRDYATRQLDDASSAALRLEHRRVYLEVVEPMVEMLHGPEEKEARRRYREELPNIERAVRSAVEDDFDHLVALVLAMLPFEADERNAEALEWFTAAAADPRLERHDSRAKVLAAAASLVRHTDDHDRAERLALDAIEFAGDDLSARALAESVLGAVQTWRGNRLVAAEHFGVAAALAGDAGEPRERVHHTAMQAATLARIDPERSLEITDQVMDLADDVGQPTASSLVHFARAIAFAQSDFDRAAESMEHAIDLGRSGGNDAGVNRTMIDLAELRARQGGSLEEAMAAKLDGLALMSPEGGVFHLWNAVASCLRWFVQAGLDAEVVALGTGLERTPLRRSKTLQSLVRDAASGLEPEALAAARALGSSFDVRDAQAYALSVGERWLDRVAS